MKLVAPDGSRESVKCQVRQEACAPRWSNQLFGHNHVDFTVLLHDMLFLPLIRSG